MSSEYTQIVPVASELTVTVREQMEASSYQHFQRMNDFVAANLREGREVIYFTEPSGWGGPTTYRIRPLRADDV